MRAAIKEMGMATATSGTAAVEVRALVKRFQRVNKGGEVIPVNNVSLDVAEGEMVVLLGPSGCGKTTLLRCVAGLEKPESGSITIGGKEVYNSDRGVFLPPEKRPISMIFQSYALWPHLLVEQNIAYPLECQGLSKAEIKERVGAVVAMVGLEGLERQYPGQLSGGQQQRVALARSVVADAKVVLFDEPLSNVDAKVRASLRIGLAQMQDKLKFSALYVTHDQIEAMELADRIAVINNGVIEQLGGAHEIYERPHNLYVANFIGSTNSLKARVVGREGPDLIVLETPIGTAHVQERNFTPDALRGHERDTEAMFVSRPERWRIVADDEVGGVNCWRGIIETTLYAGSHTEYVVRIADETVLVWSASGEIRVAGDSVWLSVLPSSAFVLLPSSGVAA